MIRSPAAAMRWAPVAASSTRATNSAPRRRCETARRQADIRPSPARGNTSIPAKAEKPSTAIISCQNTPASAPRWATHCQAERAVPAARPAPAIAPHTAARGLKVTSTMQQEDHGRRQGDLGGNRKEGERDVHGCPSAAGRSASVPNCGTW